MARGGWRSASTRSRRGPGAGPSSRGGGGPTPPAGTFVFVRDPAVPRAAVAAEPDTAVLALGGPPDFDPSDSEWIERARPHLRADPKRAQAILEELRAAKPDSPAAGIAAAFMALARDDRPAARAALHGVLAERPHL